MPSAIFKTCATCGGSGLVGKVFNYFTCTECKGKGLVEDKLPLKLKEDVPMNEQKCMVPNETAQDIYNQIHQLEARLTDIKTSVGILKRSLSPVQKSIDLLDGEYKELLSVYQRALSKVYKPL